MCYIVPTRMLRLLAQASSIVLLLGQSAIASPGVVFQTSVAPQPDEDHASPCRYEITLIDPSRTVRGVWVIFDRGRDMLRYYGDPDVQAFAQRHDLSSRTARRIAASSTPSHSCSSGSTRSSFSGRRGAPDRTGSSRRREARRRSAPLQFHLLIRSGVAGPRIHGAGPIGWRRQRRLKDARLHRKGCSRQGGYPVGISPDCGSHS